MKGYYKFSRNDLVKIIKKSFKTKDNYFICKSFPKLSKEIGFIKDFNIYTFSRELFYNKICFSNEDISIFLDTSENNENKVKYILEMKRKDEYLSNIIKDFITEDQEEINFRSKIENSDFSLEELIDSSLFIYNYKFTY